MQIDLFESKDLIRGETREKGIMIWRPDGAQFAVTSATYQTFKSDGTPIMQIPATATIEYGTHPSDDALPEAERRFAAMIHAGVPADETGQQYVEFTYTVGSLTLKARHKYRVV
ncbi:MAG: hypothetical protein ACM3ZU_07890 [Bacteroidota bacterium]